MRDCSVRGDDEIKTDHCGGAIDERIGASVEIIAEALNAESAIWRLNVDSTFALHKADQAHAFNRRKGSE